MGRPGAASRVCAIACEFGRGRDLLSNMNVKPGRSRSGGRAGALAVVALVVASWSGCVARGGAAGPFPELSPYSGREIAEVNFLAPQPYGRDTLLSLIETQPTRCRLIGLPICIPGTGIGRHVHTLNTSTLATDVVRLAVLYRQSGYFGTTVRPGVEPKGGRVVVNFAILRGDAVRLDSLTVEGTEKIVPPDSVERRLPLQPGELFDVGRFGASADTVLAVLRSRGYAYAEVLRNYSVDTVQDRATASLLAIAGPRVRVDSVVVIGAAHLGRPSVLRQLEFSQGELLRASALRRSQANLYNLDIVRFATVDVAPDSLQATPSDSTLATVAVRISEAPVHVVEAAIGYGTIECMRAHASWTSRSVLGGGRRLSIQAEATKLGLGGLTYSRQLESSICKAFATEDDPFRKELDYHLGADFTQPYFFSAHNQLTLSVFGDRTSEPGLFQRQARGGRATVIRTLRGGDVVSGAAEAQRGQTIASPAIFCLAFTVCDQAEIEPLSRVRWRNALTANFLRNRTDQPLDPHRGFRVQSTVTWAARPLGSDVGFFRWAAESARYDLVGRSTVLSSYVRLGTFFGTGSIRSSDHFLPPEERFYAGGANSVRGFDRNAIGPGVYVAQSLGVDSAGVLVVDTTRTPEFVPVGGTSVAVGSVELRFPSPLLRDYLRLAIFVDAGAVGARQLWHLDPSTWRITPGAGLRLDTPVGPARLDIAYDPYDPEAAPLYVADQATNALVRIDPSFAPGPPHFLNRFRIHVAVGQAF